MLLASKAAMGDYLRVTASAEPLLSQPIVSLLGSLLKQLGAIPTPAGSTRR